MKTVIDNPKKQFIAELKNQIKCYQKMLRDMEEADSKTVSRRTYDTKSPALSIRQASNEIIGFANYPTARNVDEALKENNKVFLNIMMLRYALEVERNKEKEEGYVSNLERVFG